MSWGRFWKGERGEWEHMLGQYVKAGPVFSVGEVCPLCKVIQSVLDILLLISDIITMCDLSYLLL